MRAAAPTDAETLALGALTALLTDARRAHRFLDLTGLSRDELRSRVGDTQLLAAALRFLEGHEPDLLAVAALIGCSAQALVQARIALEENQ